MISRAKHKTTSDLVQPAKRNPVQLNDEAKAKLDHIKQVANVDTYNDAVAYLYKLYKKSLPSMAGSCPGIAKYYEREGDDPYRVPH